MTAFGRGYFSNAFLNAAASMFHVSRSESIKTGTAFSYLTGLTLAAKVREGINTTSFSFTPAKTTDKCNAAVPDESAAEEDAPT